jgi:hypothetical protein
MASMELRGRIQKNGFARNTYIARYLCDAITDAPAVGSAGPGGTGQIPATAYVMDPVDVNEVIVPGKFIVTATYVQYNSRTGGSGIWTYESTVSRNARKTKAHNWSLEVVFDKVPKASAAALIGGTVASTASCTITLANPTVFTFTGATTPTQNFADGTPVKFTAGTMPSGFALGSTYYLKRLGGSSPNFTYSLYPTAGLITAMGSLTAAGSITAVANSGLAMWSLYPGSSSSVYASGGTDQRSDPCLIDVQVQDDWYGVQHPLCRVVAHYDVPTWHEWLIQNPNHAVLFGKAGVRKQKVGQDATGFVIHGPNLSGVHGDLRNGYSVVRTGTPIQMIPNPALVVYAVVTDRQTYFDDQTYKLGKINSVALNKMPIPSGGRQAVTDCTISSASPALFTLTGVILQQQPGTAIEFTAGTLPSGFALNTPYYMEQVGGATPNFTYHLYSDIGITHEMNNTGAAATALSVVIEGDIAAAAGQWMIYDMSLEPIIAQPGLILWGVKYVVLFSQDGGDWIGVGTSDVLATKVTQVDVLNSGTGVVDSKSVGYRVVALAGQPWSLLDTADISFLDTLLTNSWATT